MPPDAMSSGRYENLTDSLQPLDSGSYAQPPARSHANSFGQSGHFGQSGSGEYDHPTELDRHSFRRRFA